MEYEEPLFIETLPVRDGIFEHPVPHALRMRKTLLEVFGKEEFAGEVFSSGAGFLFGKGFPSVAALSEPEGWMPLSAGLPDSCRRGRAKCRIVYGRTVRSIEFSPYVPRKIRSLRLVEDNTIDYHLKYADRTALERLLSQRGACDDILIVRNGEITDTGYSNVLLWSEEEGYVTPASFLLNGTRRRRLLEEGRIREERITPEMLGRFRYLYPINAMLAPEEDIRVETSAIVFR